MFDLDTDLRLGEALAADLDTALSPLERRSFEDGEQKIRPLADPRGDDVYVLHALHGGPHQSPHDKLMSLLMFVATLADHGADRVTAVVPYLAYARKDRRTKPFDPLGSRYVVQMLEHLGAAQLIVLEAHNPAALENAARRPLLHLETHRAFDPVADEFRSERVVVASPDPGGVKRAQLWREHLVARRGGEVGFAMLDKRRSADVVSGEEAVVGDVRGATVLLIDDLVASGHTLIRAATALRLAGARRVIACCAHGLFVKAADHSLGDPALDRVVVCDSVPAFRVADASPLRPKLQVVSCVPLLAEAIRASHAAWLR